MRPLLPSQASRRALTVTQVPMLMSRICWAIPHPRLVLVDHCSGSLSMQTSEEMDHRLSTTQKDQPTTGRSRRSSRGLLIVPVWTLSPITTITTYGHRPAYSTTASHIALSPFSTNVRVPTLSSVSRRRRRLTFVDNQEFCKIPLTCDLQINPFQYRKGACAEPLFLVHAAMALAGHHVESRSTAHHRGTALQLLREGLDIPGNLADVYHMLDAIVILFSLDVCYQLWLPRAIT